MNRKIFQLIIDLLLLRHLIRLVAKIRSRKRDSTNIAQSRSLDAAESEDQPDFDFLSFLRRVGKNLVIGLTTPPVGVCLFVAASIGKISLGRISRAGLPLLAVSLTVLMLVTYVPAISTALPNWVERTKQDAEPIDVDESGAGDPQARCATTASALRVTTLQPRRQLAGGG